MARISLRFGSSLALAAALSMAASPALARHGWHGHHGHGVDAEDVLVGALIFGGIAAIASAASKPKERVVYRDPPPEPYPETRPEYRPEYAPRPPSSDRGGGMGNAVDMCVDQVERGEETVASVDAAARTPDGWRISGQLGSGGGFGCWIDNDGRVRNVDLGGTYQGASIDESAGEQWDDAAYTRAREQQAAAEAGDSEQIDGDLAAADY